jgi:hypothetical protein
VRTANLLQQYVDVGLYPTIAPPAFSREGGAVTTGFSITLNNTPNNGTGIIMYTLDGSDPRVAGGAVSASAVDAGDLANITINAPTTIKARVRNGTVWSALHEGIFLIAQDVSGLMITELMYHPTDEGDPLNGGIDGNEFEFLELLNNGAATINLDGIHFTSGIDYSFPAGTQLGAGERLVLASNTTQFENRYGFTPFGQYLGRLSNSGETIELQDGLNQIIDQVPFSDLPPWPTSPDGSGPSLELIDPALDNSLAASWQASALADGTPGAPNSSQTPPVSCDSTVPALVINEINYNSALTFNPEDWVELYNPTGSAINLQNWSFQDETANFVIPAGTIIPANGFLVLIRDEALFTAVYPTVSNYVVLGFGLSGAGERIRLLHPSSCLVDEVTYDDTPPWPVGPDGNGPTLQLIDPALDNSLPQSWQASAEIGGTPGTANPSQPPPTPCNNTVPGLVINEINYNSALTFNPEDWVELYNPTASAINLENWSFQDEAANFVIPAGTSIAANGFLMLIRDEALFTAVYPTVANYVVLGFGLSGAGERIRLLHPSSCLVDEVTYDDVPPWPTEPDGNGPTLQLIDPALDNSLAASWQASAQIGGTPGLPTQPVISNGPIFSDQFESAVTR